MCLKLIFLRFSLGTGAAVWNSSTFSGILDHFSESPGSVRWWSGLYHAPVTCWATRWGAAWTVELPLRKEHLLRWILEEAVTVPLAREWGSDLEAFPSFWVPQTSLLLLKSLHDQGNLIEGTVYFVSWFQRDKRLSPSYHGSVAAGRHGGRDTWGFLS